MDESNLSSISRAVNDMAIGMFWDNHDFTDLDTDAPDVEFEIVRSVPIELELFSEIAQQARRRGVGAETLINLWLRQKLDEQAAV